MTSTTAQYHRIALSATTVNQAWSKACFGDTLSSFTYCTAKFERYRDKQPQFCYFVRALTLGDQTCTAEPYVWISDIERRNGHVLWENHGRPVHAHYSIPKQGDPDHPLLLAHRASRAKDVDPMYVIQNKHEVWKELRTAVTRLTTLKKAGPRWKFNSCHLDVFLVSELAFYTASITNVPTHVSALPLCLLHLLRALISLGRTDQTDVLHQDTSRDDYRAFEVSQLPQHEQQSIMSSHHGRDDYAWHGNMLVALARKSEHDGYIQDERMLTRNITYECTQQHCEDRVEASFYCYVPVPRQWYNISARTIVSNRLVRADPQEQQHHGVPHGSLRATLMSILHRRIGGSMPCSTCRAKQVHAECQRRKDPKGIRFPRSLELDEEAAFSSKAPLRDNIELQLVFGAVKYNLIAVTLQNAGHFIIVVKLAGLWYEYDDLVQNTEKGDMFMLPTLLLLGNEDEVYRRLVYHYNAEKQYRPRTWRYTLDPASAQSVGAPRWDSSVDVSIFAAPDQVGWDELTMNEDAIQLK